MTPPFLHRRDVLGGMGAIAASAIFPQAGFARSAPVSFLVVGDWGRRGNARQHAVADAMASAAETSQSRFILSTGDNFYDRGVGSVTDSKWKSVFEDAYHHASLQTPWYVALGNHDHRGNLQAQIDYSRLSSRWRMPKRYYAVDGREVGAPDLQLFVLDTYPIVYCGRYRTRSAVKHRAACAAASAQIAWLEAALRESKAAWKLVIGHHGIYSGGRHGLSRVLINRVEPLLQRYGVQAYINGHDHDLQHIRVGPVDYICSGAGSSVRSVRAIPGTLFCARQSGFALMSLDGETLSLEMRDCNEDVIYKSDISRTGEQAGAAVEWRRQKIDKKPPPCSLGEQKRCASHP